MSTPRSLEMPDHVRSATVQTARGTFAVLEAQPCRGVSYRKPALLVPGFTGSKEDFLAVIGLLGAMLSFGLRNFKFLADGTRSGHPSGAPAAADEPAKPAPSVATRSPP